MKKLMIMAAVALMATVSQAYQIKWGARNIYIPVADDTSKSQSGIVAASGDKFAAGALSVALYWVSTSGNEYIGSYQTTGSGVISATNNILGDGTTSELYLAMVGDRGAEWKPQYYYTATYTTKDGTYTYTGTDTASSAIGNLGSANIVLTSKFDETGSWNYEANEPETTPEPTSGLLMLIGMAGLVLRRKRA